MESCNNPDCPQHGTSKRAIAFRETRQRIVTNTELMDVVRVLSANVDTRIIQEAGDDPDHPMYVQAHMNMLVGDDDRHPLIQGLINGLVILLQQHRPTQEFFANCQDVPEEKTFLSEQRARHTRVTEDPGHFQVFSFRSGEEFFDFLSKGGRDG